ncbi:MAG TPA: hypothetical protein V6D47_21235 [Oscillatoriaceae cyanobacterium]
MPESSLRPAMFATRALEAKPANPLIPDAPIAWPLLSAEDCRTTLAAILDLRARWIQRHHEAPFYSLGAVSYLDAEGGPEARARYEAIAARENPVLMAIFGDLIRRVAASISEHLGQPVRLTVKQALPGFHVFLSHPGFEQQVAPIHTDKQYELLDWEGGVPEEVFSVTLPIAVPEHGAWMNVWGVHSRDWPMVLPEGWQHQLIQSPKHHVSYTPGELVFHTGQFVHRIAPSRALGPDDVRVTLQAHGVLLNGVWELYW